MRVNLTDLFSIRRGPGESIDKYLARFRVMRNRCFTPIPESEMVKMVANGLDFNIRKKLVNQQFLDLTQLAEKVRQIEQLKAKKERIERTKLRKVFRKEQVNFVEMESEEDEDDFESNEINLAEIRAAELQAGPPYVCASLRPMKGKEKTNTGNKSYSFDITKVDQIFDVLLQDKQIVLPEGKKMPSAEEIKNRKFCKYHQIIGHSTNNCVRFRDLIQKAIKDGRLKFEEKS